jgi:predicted amidohydrolase
LARANENQVFVAHSSLIGELGYEPVPKTYGSSAILGPAVEPFPASSILRETELNHEGVIVADLDLALLRKTRRGAEAANWADRDSATWEMTDALPASPEESLFSGPSDTNPNGELN